MEQITHEYDCLGRCICTITDEGVVNKYQYDPLGNVTMQHTTDSKGDSVEFLREYDKANRLVAEYAIKNATKTIQRVLRYDALGHCIENIDGGGNVTAYAYDCLSRIIKITYPSLKTVDNQIIVPQETIEYDALDRITKQTDRAGYTLQKQYTALGNPMSISHPEGASEKMEYALDGTLIKHLQKDGTRLEYECDNLARPLASKHIAANNSIITTVEKCNGPFHVLSEKNSNGIATAYRYNHNGQCCAITYSAAASNVNDVAADVAQKGTHIQYLEHGRCIQETSWSHSLDKIEKRAQTYYDAKGTKSSTSIVDENENILFEHSFKN